MLITWSIGLCLMSEDKDDGEDEFEDELEEEDAENNDYSEGLD